MLTYTNAKSSFIFTDSEAKDLVKLIKEATNENVVEFRIDAIHENGVHSAELHVKEYGKPGWTLVKKWYIGNYNQKGGE